MVVTTNYKYACSSSNYYVIMMVQNFQIFQFFSNLRGTKCRVEANNNREAVVVYVRHIVKTPSKLSALVWDINIILQPLTISAMNSSDNFTLIKLVDEPFCREVPWPLRAEIFSVINSSATVACRLGDTSKTM